MIILVTRFVLQLLDAYLATFQSFARNEYILRRSIIFTARLSGKLRTSRRPNRTSVYRSEEKERERERFVEFCSTEERKLLFNRAGGWFIDKA